MRELGVKANVKARVQLFVFSYFFDVRFCYRTSNFPISALTQIRISLRKIASPRVPFPNTILNVFYF